MEIKIVKGIAGVVRQYKLWGLKERFDQRQLYRDSLIKARQEVDKELAKLRKEIDSYDA